MKYFEIEIPKETAGQVPDLCRASEEKDTITIIAMTKRGVKAVLDRLPTTDGVRIYLAHWYRDDFVGYDEYSVDDFLKTAAKKIMRGATAQWSAARGEL